ncbi:hypothetical protein Pstr01_18790 [Pseudomonas straminea]|uniref:hypothetical protein n=1 Tax=Pseudomonas straminea TaxID=47882 RepID=UPI0011609CE9|nr:hypothetical protein [Pseudomonas straminea]GLX13640.1 hypothetical protein Pstr01_18790 [Pseudomonas straminea]
MKTAIGVIGVAFAVAVAVSGCEKSPEVRPDSWNAEATAYFNKNVPPLKSLRGDKYHLQVVREEGNYACVTRAFVDGIQVDYTSRSAVQVLPGNIDPCQFDGVHVEYTRDDGYRVFPGDNLPSSVKAFLYAEIPSLFRKYQ